MTASDDPRRPNDDTRGADDDIVEVIRRADPFAGVGDVPPRGYDLDQFIASAMGGERPLSVGVARELRRQSPGKRRKRRIAIITAAVVLGSAGAAAAYVIARDQPDEPAGGIACHGDASNDGATEVIDLADDPIAACAALWIAGVLPDPDHPLPPGQTAPALVACTGPDRALGVFPGENVEVCERLGLVAADVVLSDQSRAIVELQVRLVDATYPGCASKESAVSTATALLDEMGLSDWSTETVEQERPQDVCARVAVDASTRTITIAMGPPTSTSSSPQSPAATPDTAS